MMCIRLNMFKGMYSSRHWSYSRFRREYSDHKRVITITNMGYSEKKFSIWMDFFFFFFPIWYIDRPRLNAKYYENNYQLRWNFLAKSEYYWWRCTLSELVMFMWCGSMFLDDLLNFLLSFFLLYFYFYLQNIRLLAGVPYEMDDKRRYSNLRYYTQSRIYAIVCCKKAGVEVEEFRCYFLIYISFTMSFFVSILLYNFIIFTTKVLSKRSLPSNKNLKLVLQIPRW